MRDIWFMHYLIRRNVLIQNRAYWIYLINSGIFVTRWHFCALSVVINDTFMTLYSVSMVMLYFWIFYKHNNFVGAVNGLGVKINNVTLISSIHWTDVMKLKCYENILIQSHIIIIYDWIIKIPWCILIYSTSYDHVLSFL